MAVTVYKNNIVFRNLFKHDLLHCVRINLERTNTHSHMQTHAHTHAHACSHIHMRIHKIHKLSSYPKQLS